MDRRDFLKSSLFGSAASLVPMVNMVNREVNDNNNNSFVAPKGSTAHGCFVRCFDTITGSRDFPLRPMNTIATDGTFLWFVWPSPKGGARGYIRPFGQLPEDLQQNPLLNVFMLAQSEPTCPYYLRWRSGDYYMYTAAPALVERAASLIRLEDDGSKVQALSDMRFAMFINVAFSGKRHLIHKLVRLEEQVRETWHPERFWEMYKELLTESRP